MKQSKYSEAQIMGILNQAESRVPVADLCREHGMSTASFYIRLTVDFNENLVNMPLPLARSHTLNTAFLNLGREHRSKAIPPKPNCLMANFDAALMEQIFNIPK